LRKLAGLSPTSWLTTKTVFSQIFAVAVFAIQAPVLGPRAFGLVSIVTVFVGFCETVFGDALADALISVRKIEPIHFDTVNTLSVAVSLVMGGAAVLFANAVARWFGDPELASLLRWMALLPVISALAAAPTAATKRDMQFQPLALRSMISLFIGGVVGVVMALTGFGVWALVWQAIVTRVVASVVLWRVVPVRLRFGFSSASCADILPFAAPVLMSRTLGWASSQFPRLIFGFFWGPTELGIFGLAARLCDILVEVTLMPRYAVTRVELRRFADDPPGLEAAFSKILTSASVVCFALAVGGAAVTPTLFHAWLDARWYAGILPASLMMLMCIPQVSHYCAGAVLLAMNQQKAEALNSVMQSIATVIAVVAFAPLGLLPATAAYAARPLLLLPVPALLLRDKCALPPRTLFGAQTPALIAAAIMGIGVTLLRIVLEPYLRSILLLPLLIAAGGLMYAGAIRALLPEVAREYALRVGLKKP
jgi:O-antigen/teichoic acid export membrane protein